MLKLLMNNEFFLYMCSISLRVFQSIKMDSKINCIKKSFTLSKLSYFLKELGYEDEVLEFFLKFCKITDIAVIAGGLLRYMLMEGFLTIRI
jgi:hypothetical protein